MPYGTHGYVNDTNFECGGGGGSGGRNVEVKTEIVKEYVTKYIHDPPVEVTREVTKFVDRVHYVNRTVVKYVDRPVVKYVDKPVVKYVPAPAAARPEMPPAKSDDEWTWIHRVRQQLSKPNGWAGHKYLGSTFEPLKPVTFDSSRPLPSVGKPLTGPARPQPVPSPKAVEPAARPPTTPAPVVAPVVAPRAAVARFEPSEGDATKQFYWVADQDGNILGPARSGVVAAESHAPETPIVVRQEPPVNQVYVQHAHVLQPRAQIVVQHHPVVVHVPPITVSYQKGGGKGAGARLSEVKEGGKAKEVEGKEKGARLSGPADVKA